MDDASPRRGLLLARGPHCSPLYAKLVLRGKQLEEKEDRPVRMPKHLFDGGNMQGLLRGTGGGRLPTLLHGSYTRDIFNPSRSIKTCAQRLKETLRWALKLDPVQAS